MFPRNRLQDSNDFFPSEYGMKATIKHIECYFPEQVLTNKQLASEFPAWSVEKIEEKTGIIERHIAKDDECASDLGVMAVKKLFDAGVCSPKEIDYLILCTQSPDYFLPTTACIIQDRIGIPKTSGALDFNLGCSGYIYGLGLAKGLIETGQAQNIILITAETYSKFIHPGDKSVRTLFGDAAAATLLQGVESDHDLIGPFIYGTDGNGANNLIVPHGGLRHPITTDFYTETVDRNGNIRTLANIYMNGSEIFTFTLTVIPKTLNSLLSKARIEIDDVDLFIFHQANKFMLDRLRKKLRIPEEKFHLSYQNVGNTVSSTIPIGLDIAQKEGRLKMGDKVVLIGFGVGYSWGGTIIEW